MEHCDGTGHVYDAQDDDGSNEGDDTFGDDINDNSLPKTFRKIRTNSYHRAILTPPKILVHSESLSSVKERSEDPSLLSSGGVLYQEVKERGVTNADEEDEFIMESLKGSCINRQGMQRQSWSCLPQVQQSDTLSRISPKERKRQESMFELMTSEASYLRSLNVLVNYFMASDELRACITNTEFHHLFSNVEAVRTASRKFYHSLMRRRKSSAVNVTDVCDIILDHVTSGAFQPYVTYCSNETYQQRVLQKLMDSNPEFLQVLRNLEKGEECAGLPLHSFLLLPMQRITRLPLLVDTILQRCDITMPQYDSASRALRETTNLVKACNERAKTLERTEQMIQLQQQLDFKSSRSFALVSPSRFLVKQGLLTRIQEEFVLGFKRVTRQEVCLFLFNDVLLIAKKKSDDSYTVSDYCSKERLRSRDVINDPVGFILVIEQNQENQRSELRFEADKASTKARWMAVLSNQPRQKQTISSSNLQVEVIRSLRTEEPDMISLKILDVYVLLETTSDGWYYGERISDGGRGWFPSAHVKEILNVALREKNLQRRNRMLGEATVV